MDPKIESTRSAPKPEMADAKAEHPHGILSRQRHIGSQDLTSCRQQISKYALRSPLMRLSKKAVSYERSHSNPDVLMAQGGEGSSGKQVTMAQRQQSQPQGVSELAMAQLQTLAISTEHQQLAANNRLQPDLAKEKPIVAGAHDSEEDAFKLPTASSSKLAKSYSSASGQPQHPPHHQLERGATVAGCSNVSQSMFSGKGEGLNAPASIHHCEKRQDLTSSGGFSRLNSYSSSIGSSNSSLDSPQLFPAVLKRNIEKLEHLSFECEELSKNLFFIVEEEHSILSEEEEKKSSGRPSNLKTKSSRLMLLNSHAKSDIKAACLAYLESIATVEEMHSAIFDEMESIQEKADWLYTCKDLFPKLKPKPSQGDDDELEDDEEEINHSDEEDVDFHKLGEGERSAQEG